MIDRQRKIYFKELAYMIVVALASPTYVEYTISLETHGGVAFRIQNQSVGRTSSCLGKSVFLRSSND